MSEGKKLSILQDILGSYARSGGEYLFKCLWCNHHKKKLSVNLSKDKYKCWICDRAGSTHRLVKRLGSFLQQQTWRELTGIVEVSEFEKIILNQESPEVQEEEKVIDLPQEFETLCNKNTSLTATQALGYLNKRGIEKSDILRWKIGYCSQGEYSGRIIVPSFNDDGKVNYFIARSYEKNWRKYKNPPESKDLVFNSLYVDWDEDIVLTEGVFDAIKIPNSIPILGSSLRENSKLFQQIIKHDSAVYMALDPDAESKEFKMIESLLKYGIEVYKVPIKPYKDAGEMSRQEFMDRKKKASLIRNTDYLLLDKIMSI
jgi:DNA primase